MKNFINKNKGITLIALIITIIVMLILAGISISAIVGEDGIIAQAEKAGEEQRGATVQEHRDLWKSSINTDQLSGTSSAQTLDEVVEDLKIELITEEEAEKIINEGYVVIGSRKIVFWDKLMIGDYVDYHPDKVTEPYKKVGETYTGRGTNDDAPIMQDDTIRYRILNINENTVDIIGDANNVWLQLEGPMGYNNGVAIINDYCKTMYSNKSLGVEARSINIEDIKDKLNNFTPTNYGIKYTVTETKYPKEWPSPNNTIEEYEERAEATKIITSGEVVEQNSWGNGHIISKSFKNVNMREKEDATYYDIFKQSKSYYLATYFHTGSVSASGTGNQIEGKSGKLYFGILNFKNAIYSRAMTHTNQFESNAITIGANLRPIITLPKDAINVDLDYDTEVGWKIKSNY